GSFNRAVHGCRRLGVHSGRAGKNGGYDQSGSQTKQLHPGVSATLPRGSKFSLWRPVTADTTADWPRSRYANWHMAGRGCEGRNPATRASNPYREYRFRPIELEIKAALQALS